jgi:hypothetical protein
MTDEHDLTTPRATPAPHARTPSFAASQHTGATHPLHDLAPDLDQPWCKEDPDTPDRTTLYTHPDGHRIGLRLQPGDLTIQTWITAGPDLPPIPAGTAAEKAEAQAANDARLQPGRSWHATIPTRHTDDLPAAIDRVLRDQLIPALTNKPKHVLTVTYERTSQIEPQSESPAPKRRTASKSNKKGTQK